MSSLLSANLQIFICVSSEGLCPLRLRRFPPIFFGTTKMWATTPRMTSLQCAGTDRRGPIRMTAKMFATARGGLATVRRLRMRDRLSLTQLPVLGV